MTTTDQLRTVLRDLEAKAKEMELDKKLTTFADQADQFLRDAATRAGDYAAENRERVEATLDKAGAKVDEKTEGKYHSLRRQGPRRRPHRCRLGRRAARERPDAGCRDRRGRRATSGCRRDGIRLLTRRDVERRHRRAAPADRHPPAPQIRHLSTSPTAHAPPTVARAIRPHAPAVEHQCLTAIDVPRSGALTRHTVG